MTSQTFAASLTAQQQQHTPCTDMTQQVPAARARALQQQQRRLQLRRQQQHCHARLARQLQQQQPQSSVAAVLLS
jgi:hypothetical protein